jgi:hypothetical protein
MSRITQFVVSVGLCLAATPVMAGVPLDIAVKTGKVSVTVTGRGASSGDSINLYVQKTVPETLRIDIQPGLVFRSKSGKAQSMVFRRVRFEKVQGGYKKATEIVLQDGKKHHFILEAYCRDHGKPTPRSSDQFAIEPQNKTEAAIIARGTEIDVTNKILQVAIWLQRSGEEPAKARNRFRVSTDEFKVATGLVQSARRQPARPAANTNVAATEVEVELKNLMAGLRTRLQATRVAAGYQRGDRARIAKASADLTATRNGKRVLVGLRRGDEVEVIRVAGDRVFCAVTADNKTRRGWLAKADLSARVATRPAPVGGLLRESALEALDKLDINVGTDDTNISVGRERSN